MDQILRGHLTDFARQYDLEGLSEPQQFEHFVNYCVLAPEVVTPIDLQDVGVGGGDDTGLDGVAIVVNDQVVTSTDQLADLQGSRRRLDVLFVFVQSKTGTKFDMGEMGNFFFGVHEFFDPSARLPANDDIVHARKLAEKVFERSIDFRQNPRCMLCYASSGEWLGDARLQARVNQELERLRATKLFSDVIFKPLDADALKASYKSLQRRFVAEIEFERHAIMPKIERISVAYSGVLPLSEYMKIITLQDGRLNRSVFYENIRDFQGSTPVNEEIAATLSDRSTQFLLPVLNNGITVIARAVDPVGTTFRLTDFQVVNGCQTSHAIYNAREYVDGSVCIPIRLVATEDPDVMTRVIRATNRQTEIKPEAFVALSPFHKELEDLFVSLARTSPRPLYYERRSRQYDASSVKPHQVVTVASQVASFTAVFLEEPHSCHRYYGELIAAYRERLFGERHRTLPYYLSSYLLHRIEGMFWLDRLPRYLRPLRYHMALLVRLAATRSTPPSLESKKMDEFCEGILARISNNRDCAAMVEESSERLKQELQRGAIAVREAARTKAFTQSLVGSRTRGASSGRRDD